MGQILFFSDKICVCDTHAVFVCVCVCARACICLLSVSIPFQILNLLASLFMTFGVNVTTEGHPNLINVNFCINCVMVACSFGVSSINTTWYRDWK